MNKNYPIHFALRYGFFLVAILCLLQYALSTEDLSARPQGQEDDPFADSDVDSSGVSLCITLTPFADIAAGVYDPTAPPSTATNTPLPPTATSMPVPPTPANTTVAPTPAYTTVAPTSAYSYAATGLAWNPVAGT